MAATLSNQKLMLSALDESGKQTVAHFIPYENLLNNRFWLWLCVVIFVFLLSGLVYVVLCVRKRKPDRDTVSMNVTGASGDASDEWTSGPAGHLVIPARYREVFVQTMEEDLSILNQALYERRLRAVLSMLHRMHGALAAVGATELAERCESLGQAASVHGLDDELSAKIADLASDLMRMTQWQHTI